MKDDHPARVIARDAQRLSMRRLAAIIASQQQQQQQQRDRAGEYGKEPSWEWLWEATDKDDAADPNYVKGTLCSTVTAAASTSTSISPSSLNTILCTAPSLPVHLRQPIFELFKENMYESYTFNQAWDEAGKKAELFDHPQSTFLCLFTDKNDNGDEKLVESSAMPSSSPEPPPIIKGENLVGFVMFRFDTEMSTRDDAIWSAFLSKHEQNIPPAVSSIKRVDKKRKPPSSLKRLQRLLPVLYIYEIQLKRSCRSLRLGSYLLDTLHHLASFHPSATSEVHGSKEDGKMMEKMEKTMLTCWRLDRRLVEWYAKRGWSRDAICPSFDEEGEGDQEELGERKGYYILSRVVQ